jgi:hypothetical protein
VGESCHPKTQHPSTVILVFAVNCWLQLVPQHVTLMSTVHC